MKKLLAAALGLFALCVHAAAKTPPELADFDRFVEAQLRLWNVPGVSVVVVQGDKVLLAKGYGWRDLERKLPMTADTVQPIASITKSFTVAALATLVRDGKLSWDVPVRDIAPDFRLIDEAAAARISLRDMVTHRTGLSRNDRAWLGSPFTREQLYQRLRYFSMDYGLRERFGYNNLMYMTAGYLGGRVAGSSWEELVQRSLFDPLGMTRSSFTLDALRRQPDYANGYQLDDKQQPQPEPYQALDAMGPTGAINASANDMGRYVQMFVNGGSFGGKTIIAPGDLVAMTSAQTVLPDARTYPELGPMQYGMGLFVQQYRGERLAEHGGNLPGASTQLAFLPDRRIGVFIGANLSYSSLPTVLMYAVFDRLLKLPSVDWSARLKKSSDELRASALAGREQKFSPRKSGTQPAHAVAEYAGEYEHGGYGLVNVTAASAGDLAVTYNGFTSKLEHFHFDVFRVPVSALDILSDLRFQFLTDVDGEVSGLRVALDISAPPIEFARLPDRALSNPEVLRRFTGEYQLGETRLTVALRPDNVLTLAAAGQSPTELRPLRGTRFVVANRPGRAVRFVAEGEAKATELTLTLPGATLVAKRVQ